MKEQGSLEIENPRAAFWKKFSKEEAEKIEDTIAEKFSRFPVVPFKIEKFCAETAWMYPRTCLVYPYPHPCSDSPISAEPCRFLWKEGYGDYACPNSPDPRDVIGAIVERGNDEQKASLEYLARMYEIHGSMEEPRFKPNPHCLKWAVIIYDGLGLNEKADKIRGQHPYLRDVRYSDEIYYLEDLEFLEDHR